MLTSGQVRTERLQFLLRTLSYRLHNAQGRQPAVLFYQVSRFVPAAGFCAYVRPSTINQYQRVVAPEHNQEQV